MGVIFRTGVGMALFAGGLTFLTYGIAQAIENGSCGTDSYGRSVGPACPSGMGPMIALMVLGTFVAIAGAGLASVGRGASGVVGGTLRFFGALTVSVIAAVVLGIVDLNPDDTRPGLEIVAAVVGPVLFFSLPALARKPVERSGPVITPQIVMATMNPEAASAAQPSAPTTPANAEDIASRLRQLDQLRESGLLQPEEYEARRKQILAEL